MPSPIPHPVHASPVLGVERGSPEERPAAAAAALSTPSQCGSPMLLRRNARELIPGCAGEHFDHLLGGEGSGEPRCKEPPGEKGWIDYHEGVVRAAGRANRALCAGR